MNTGFLAWLRKKVEEIHKSVVDQLEEVTLDLRELQERLKDTENLSYRDRPVLVSSIMTSWRDYNKLDRLVRDAKRVSRETLPIRDEIIQKALMIETALAEWENTRHSVRIRNHTESGNLDERAFEQALGEMALRYSRTLNMLIDELCELNASLDGEECSGLEVHQLGTIGPKRVM